MQIFDLSMDFSGSGVVTGINLKPETREWAKARYRKVLEGLYGMPVDLPGSALRAALQARKDLEEVLWRDMEGEVQQLKEQVR